MSWCEEDVPCPRHTHSFRRQQDLAEAQNLEKVLFAERPKGDKGRKAGGEEKMDLLVLFFQPTQPHYHSSVLNLQTIRQGQILPPLLEAKANVGVWKFWTQASKAGCCKLDIVEWAAQISFYSFMQLLPFLEK